MIPLVIFITFGQVSELIFTFVILTVAESILISVQFRRIESSETEVMVHPLTCNSECEGDEMKQEAEEENELEKMKVSEVRMLFPLTVIIAPESILMVIVFSILIFPAVASDEDISVFSIVIEDERAEL